MKDYETAAKELTRKFKKMIEIHSSKIVVAVAINEAINASFNELKMSKKNMIIKVHTNSIGQNFLKFENNIVAFVSKESRLDKFFLRFLLANTKI